MAAEMYGVDSPYCWSEAFPQTGPIVRPRLSTALAVVVLFPIYITIINSPNVKLPDWTCRMPKNKTAAVPAAVVIPIRRSKAPSDHAARTRTEKVSLE